MRYLIIILIFLIVGCTSKAELEERAKREAADALYERIQGVVMTSSYPTDEFLTIKDRLYEGEDTVFDMATRDFRVIVFVRDGAVTDTVSIPDTVIVDQTVDKTKSQWEDEPW